MIGVLSLLRSLLHPSQWRMDTRLLLAGGTELYAGSVRSAMVILHRRVLMLSFTRRNGSLTVQMRHHVACAMNRVTTSDVWRPSKALMTSSVLMVLAERANA